MSMSLARPMRKSSRAADHFSLKTARAACSPAPHELVGAVADKGRRRHRISCGKARAATATPICERYPDLRPAIPAAVPALQSPRWLPDRGRRRSRTRGQKRAAARARVRHSGWRIWIEATVSRALAGSRCRKERAAAVAPCSCRRHVPKPRTNAYREESNRSLSGVSFDSGRGLLLFLIPGCTFVRPELRFHAHQSPQLVAPAG